MARDSNKRHKIEDDLVLLQQIKEANPEAGAQYLEHLVLQKRILASSPVSLLRIK